MTSDNAGAAVATPTRPPRPHAAIFKNERRSSSLIARTVTARHRAHDVSDWKGLAHRALFTLLIFLALDAQGRLRTRFEALLTDRLFADFADAERAVFDLLQREVELREQALLATTKTELERLEVLARCEIH